LVDLGKIRKIAYAISVTKNIILQLNNFKNMKKIVLVVLTICAFNSFGQEKASGLGGNLSKGGMQVNVATGYSASGLPVILGLDYGVTEDITVGAEFSYRFKSGINVIGGGVNVNYHFNNLLSIPSPWDIYAGGSIGFYRASTSTALGSVSATAVGGGGQLGVRYFLTEKLGLLLEGGGYSGGVSGGKVGVTIRL